MIYSDKDTNVLPEQSKVMIKALERKDKSIEVLKIIGEEHSFIRTNNKEKTLNAITNFIKKHI